MGHEPPESRRAYNGTPETMLSGIEPSASISRRIPEAAENAAAPYSKEVVVQDEVSVGVLTWRWDKARK